MGDLQTFEATNRHTRAMDLLALLPTFVVAVVLIPASPGPAMALILRRAGSYGGAVRYRPSSGWRRGFTSGR